MKHLTAVAVLLFCVCGNTYADPLYNCGEYNPTVVINPSSDLALITTSRIASPGEALSQGDIKQPAWFLLDEFGAGALFGCMPNKSVVQQATQYNFYNDNGTLNYLSSQRFNPDTNSTVEAKLHFSYLTSTPNFLSSAEGFCMSIGVEKVRYDFIYENNLLTSIKQTPDSGCPNTNSVTVSFEYGDSSVPKLPTKVTVEESGHSPEITSYTYTLDGKKIKTIDVKSQEENVTLHFGYNDKNQLTTIQGPVPVPKTAGIDLALSYVNGNQWTAMHDPRFSHYWSNWGLTIKYNANNKISSTLQNTGDPGAIPDYFYY